MAIRLNTQARNAILDGGLDIFDGGTLRIYSGSQPATANLAPSGTLLAAITLPNPAYAAASSGARAKTGTWQDTSADGGSATAAGWARISESGDDGSEDGDFARLDGAFTGGEFSADGSITSGQQVTVTSHSVTLPAA
jgi:hypothetical protein